MEGVAYKTSCGENVLARHLLYRLLSGDLVRLGRTVAPPEQRFTPKFLTLPDPASSPLFPAQPLPSRPSIFEKQEKFTGKQPIRISCKKHSKTSTRHFDFSLICFSYFEHSTASTAQNWRQRRKRAFIRKRLHPTDVASAWTLPVFTSSLALQERQNLFIYLDLMTVLSVSSKPNAGPTWASLAVAETFIQQSIQSKP